MGMFSKLSSAQLFTKSKWFKDGKYLTKITAVKLVDGHKGESFIIESEVIATTSNDDDAPQSGEVAAHVWGVSGDKKQMGLATWMQFLCAVFGMEPEEQSDEEWEKISTEVLDNKSLEGTVMVLDVFTIQTKKNTPFTYHKWLHEATKEDYSKFNVKPL